MLLLILSEYFLEIKTHLEVQGKRY